MMRTGCAIARLPISSTPSSYLDPLGLASADSLTLTVEAFAEERREDLVGRAEAPQMAFLGANDEPRGRKDAGEVLAVLELDDVVGVAIEEVHGNADVADLEPPRPAEERDVLEQCFHVGAAADDDVFLEHPAHGRIVEDPPVA